MRLQDFIDSLIAAGWNATSDAQWTRIAALHKKLFPVIAQLESELEDANNEIFKVLQGEQCGTWLKDSNVNGGKRQGGE